MSAGKSSRPRKSVLPLGDRRDLRSGTFDPGTERSDEAAEPAVARHQADQHGADVLSIRKAPQPQSPLPEGLRRARKGPYGRLTGRSSKKNP